MLVIGFWGSHGQDFLDERNGASFSKAQIHTVASHEEVA